MFTIIHIHSFQKMDNGSVRALKTVAGTGAAGGIGAGSIYFLKAALRIGAEVFFEEVHLTQRSPKDRFDHHRRRQNRRTIFSWKTFASTVYRSSLVSKANCGSCRMCAAPFEAKTKHPFRLYCIHTSRSHVACRCPGHD